MTKFNVLVIFTTEDGYGEAVEEITADDPSEAIKIAVSLHNVSSGEWDVEATEIWEVV